MDIVLTRLFSDSQAPLFPLNNLQWAENQFLLVWPCSEDHLYFSSGKWAEISSRLAFILQWELEGKRPGQALNRPVQSPIKIVP